MKKLIVVIALMSVSICIVAQTPHLLNYQAVARDVSGNPIVIDKVQDVSAYMRIKSAYESGNYEHLSKDVDTLFSNYPDTIFKSEANSDPYVLGLRVLVPSDKFSCLI